MKKSTQQTGFSLITAIFLLVVIAALGAFGMSLSVTQNQSQALDVMGARGYQAAAAGVEWAAYNVNQQAANSPTPWLGCVSGATVVVSGNLAPFSPVTVNCLAASFVEGTTTVWTYEVTAIAHTSDAVGSPNYIEQVATAKFVR